MFLGLPKMPQVLEDVQNVKEQVNWYVRHVRVLEVVPLAKAAGGKRAHIAMEMVIARIVTAQVRLLVEDAKEVVGTKPLVCMMLNAMSRNGDM